MLAVLLVQATILQKHLGLPLAQTQATSLEVSKRGPLRVIKTKRGKILTAISKTVRMMHLLAVAKAQAGVSRLLMQRRLRGLPVKLLQMILSRRAPKEQQQVLLVEGVARD